MTKPKAILGKRRWLRGALHLSLAVGLAASLSACNEDDLSQLNSTTAWSPFEGFGVPGFDSGSFAALDDGAYGDEYLPPLPEALPMQASWAPSRAHANYGGGYAPGYGVAEYGHDGSYEEPGYGYAPVWYGGEDYGSWDEEPYYPDDYGYEQGASYYDDIGNGWYDESPGIDNYALLGLAALLGGVLGDSPPDYAFDYGGVQPWVWQSGDRYTRFAEPVYGGYRYYYYEPHAARPFLVRDPYYSYGYRGDDVMVIYDRDGRVLDGSRAWRQRRVATVYYDRGGDLYDASREARHYGVPAPLWTQANPVIVREQRIWDTARSNRTNWTKWDRQYERKFDRRWQRERVVRDYAANRFDQWRAADFNGSAPRFYSEARQKPQFRTAAFRDTGDRRAIRQQQAALFQRTALRQDISTERFQPYVENRREQRAARAERRFAEGRQQLRTERFAAQQGYGDRRAMQRVERNERGANVRNNADQRRLVATERRAERRDASARRLDLRQQRAVRSSQIAQQRQQSARLTQMREQRQGRSGADRIELRQQRAQVREQAQVRQQRQAQVQQARQQRAQVREQAQVRQQRQAQVQQARQQRAQVREQAQVRQQRQAQVQQARQQRAQVRQQAEVRQQRQAQVRQVSQERAQARQQQRQASMQQAQARQQQRQASMQQAQARQQQRQASMQQAQARQQQRQASMQQAQARQQQRQASMQQQPQQRPAREQRGNGRGNR